MTRIDKTESAIGVFRANLAADLPDSRINTIFGVGLDVDGRVVVGAGASGVVGVVVGNPSLRRAGKPCDVLTNGEVVDCVGLVPGTKYYAGADGALSTTNTGKAVGYTVEADRLIVRIGA